MPKRLSDPAWLAFQNDVNVEALKLPPWGGVVGWAGQLILVYVCPGTGSLCQRGEVMLSDVSDLPDLVKNIPGTYDANQEIWVYHIVPETMARAYEVAKSTLETTGKVLQTAATEIGTAAGGLTGPLLQQLAVPLVAVALIYLLFEGGRRA